MGVGRYQQVPPGILALPSFIGEDGFSNLTYTVIGIAISFVGAFAAQLILGIDEEKEKLLNKKNHWFIRLLQMLNYRKNLSMLTLRWMDKYFL